MSYQNIIYQAEPPVAWITINRPKRLNALNTDTFNELSELLTKIGSDPEIQGVLIEGAGDKAFVAGADITEIQKLNGPEGTSFSEHGQRVFDQIELLGKPVIALIDGYALGGGCELAMACHLRLATSRAKFGQPEVNLGLIPGYGATQRLPRLVGKARALEYLLTGDVMDAEQAQRIGLVNRIVGDDEDLRESGKKLMLHILTKAPMAIKYILECVQTGLDLPLQDGLKLEADRFGAACATEDMHEGTSAFLEKRKPQFRNR